MIILLQQTNTLKTHYDGYNMLHACPPSPPRTFSPLTFSLLWKTLCRLIDQVLHP